ncbi:MAG TPA: tetratricopeptide repeat protein [Pyrinomonadaceae bacterium]|nr:tetratricopeptide repeat protein [Pyrinomonadaceae bacterium]
MYYASIFLLLLVTPFQTPGDSFRKQYEVAEAHRRAGNLTAAEAEYVAILNAAYPALGRIYTAQSNYRGAVAALEAAAAHRTDTTQTLVELAIAYFHSGQYGKAADPLRRALARDPRSAPAHHMMGKTHFMMGAYDQAVRELEAALALTPNDPDVAYTLGLAYLKLRKVDEARRIFGRMVTHLEGPHLRVLIGRAYRETGFLLEAIDEFKKAAALDPRFPRVHYYLGHSYLLKDGAARLGDAMKELQLELAAHPEEFLANFYLGVIHMTEGRWTAAVPLMEKASRLQPNNPDPHFFLGQAYQSLQKYEQAIGSLKKSIALNPRLEHNDYQVTNAHYRLGQSLMKVGETKEGERQLQIASDLKSKAFKRDGEKLNAYLNTPNDAVKTAANALDNAANVLNNASSVGQGLDLQKELPNFNPAPGTVGGPGTPSARTGEALSAEAAFLEKVAAAAHNNIGLLRAERQEFRAAAEHFSNAAKWNPKHEGLDYNLGLALFKSESFKEAVAPLERESKARPSNLQVKQLLGLSFFMLEEYAKASALLTEVVAAKPNEVTLYYPLALSLSKEGNTEAADRVTRQMVALGGDSPQVHILLGMAYYEQNESAKALDELRKAISLDPKVRLAHFYAGMIHVRTGKLDEAGREFEAELALNPRDVQARYHLGYVALARQETDRGIKLMEEVIRERPDFANARFELGNALLKRGDVRGAVESLEAAVKLAPGETHIHYQLGRAYIAAGRQAEGEGQLEIARQLKEKALRQTNQ